MEDNDGNKLYMTKDQLWQCIKHDNNLNLIRDQTGQQIRLDNRSDQQALYNMTIQNMPRAKGL